MECLKDHVPKVIDQKRNSICPCKMDQTADNWPANTAKLFLHGAQGGDAGDVEKRKNQKGGCRSRAEGRSQIGAQNRVGAIDQLEGTDRSLLCNQAGTKGYRSLPEAKSQWNKKRGKLFSHKNKQTVTHLVGPMERDRQMLQQPNQ